MAKREVALILNVNKPYGRKVVAGISRFTRQRGNWRLYVEDEPLAKVPNLIHWRGDGIIADLDDPNVLEAVDGIKTPLVNIGGGVLDPAWRFKSPYVTSDNPVVAQIAADHLMNQGYANFGYCGIRRTLFNPWVRIRGKAFAESVRDQGFSCSEFYGRHTTARQWESVQTEICKWLETLSLPVAIFACNDARARHVLEGCRRLGLRIPQDVGILGVDNDELMCDLTTPALSSISLGTDKIGYESANLLNDLMLGKAVSKRRRTLAIEPIGIVPRESTSTIAIADQEVARAVKFIRSNIGDGIQVMDVAKAVDLSRSTLDNRFKQILRRTVHDEIERVRLNFTKDLLATTDHTLAAIAQQTGFASVQYLATVFRQTTGQTPGEYRRQRSPTS
ncbi:DNA-binding transcriptional regulator [Blastopirellula sp. JC732]|uniref:DNA-binding transcriptional regulator n=1 Tax=Blastopirellula sediminis TaxID=2894196 RepID=A0A9X1SEW2_9BACT|nr:DNA-binding transcriptional regulator [Blastopirellula sediminis]MCC9608045.1 DNA-binding transcriptional regulator [Blastopirellula sediminis]MCC9627162.1 DNA-binding transcriptional regulator [Blastopirellula sediminis]